MASSSNTPIPTFAGQDFKTWSKKVEEYLVEEGLWYVIEEGYERPMELRNDEEWQELREHKANDSFTLSLLHKALSPKILSEIRSERMAKAAWDALELMYYEINDPPCTSESGESSEPMRKIEENEKFPNKRKSTVLSEKVNGKRKINEPPHSSKTKRVHCAISNDHEDSLDSRDDPPASRDMPRQPRVSHCDLVLTDCAVKPDYKLHLPSTLELPSIDMMAIVRSTKLEKEYKIPFNGKQKRFGVSAWKIFVEAHKLREGHRLRLKLIECRQTSFVIEVSPI